MRMELKKDLENYLHYLKAKKLGFSMNEEEHKQTLEEYKLELKRERI